MITINTISDKYFEIDGIRFARIYQPLKQGLDNVGIYSIYDTRKQLVNSTDYSEFTVNGATFANQADAIEGILAAVYNAAYAPYVFDLEERINNLEENQYSGVQVYTNYSDLPAVGTLLVSYKVSNDQTDPALNGFYHWSGSAYIKDADLNQDIIDDVTYLKIKEDNLTRINDFESYPENLVDNSTNVIDYFVNWNTGELVYDVLYDTSQYVKVKPSTIYLFSNSTFYAFYDSNFVYISGSNAGGSVTSPANAAYVRQSRVKANPLMYIVEYISVGDQISYSPQTKVALQNLKLVQENLNDEFVVDEINASFFELKKNLMNPDTIEAGFYISGTNGGLVVNATYSCSWFIPVEENTNYIYSGSGSGTLFAWYNSKREYISGSNSVKPTLSPANAKYIRVSFTAGNELNVQFEKGTEATTYERYGFNLKDEYKTVNQGQTSFYERTKNLFNPETINEGVFVNWNNGDLASNPIYDASDYIEVNELTDYFAWGDGIVEFLAWYDSDRVFISGVFGGSYPFQSPADAKYIRFTIDSGTARSIHFEANTEFSYFEPYYRLIQDRLNNGWLGLLWSAMGDSITASYRRWQEVVNLGMGWYFKNNGAGGTKISGTGTTAMCNDVRINAIDINSDLVSVMGGTNDWFNSVPLGVISSVDVTEFYGALNVMCEKLTTRFPDKRIVLVTPPYGLIGTTKNEAASKNSLGLSCADYGQCVKEVGLKWGIPVVDMLGGCGWNYVNIDSYVINDGNYLHPSDVGGERMATVLVPYFKGINPYKQ